MHMMDDKYFNSQACILLNTNKRSDKTDVQKLQERGQYKSKMYNVLSKI